MEYLESPIKWKLSFDIMRGPPTEKINYTLSSDQLYYTVWSKYYSGFASIPILLAILMCVTNQRTYHPHSTSIDMHLVAPACKHRSLRSLLLECYYSNCSSFHSMCSILSLSLLHLRPLDGPLLTTQAHAFCSGS